MSRPSLTKHLSATDFQSYYWLKEELLSFCRAHHLSTSGAKKDLTMRVALFLQNGTATDEALLPKATTAKRQMPSAFERATVIGPGWRCSQALRAFFEGALGPQFHFNGLMRDFIQHGAGKTLQDAIDAWERGQKTGQGAREIAPQFEYNRHIREYFQNHPGATLQGAIAAWNEKRAQRRDAGA